MYLLSIVGLSAYMFWVLCDTLFNSPVTRICQTLHCDCNLFGGMGVAFPLAMAMAVVTV